MSGQRFGRLIAVERTNSSTDGDHAPIWRCVCDCGKEVLVTSGNLMSGKTQSCGCEKAESLLSLHQKNIVHGGYSKNSDAATKRLFGIWIGMKRRCESPGHKDYHYYGERGISVCDDWHIFDNFREWSLSNGYAEGLSIDRIDVNLGYNPLNCRWATAKTQCNNKRNNRFLTFNGQTHTAKEWSRVTNIGYYTILNRIDHLGWSVERALTTVTKGV
ncbi:MAG: hypothetical protein NC548_56865 [Lachnospiraceae bacterium]|nr:hypothetical protein [Lachnospiraceae bacterium]